LENKRNNRKGLTLIEVLLVLAILVLIAGVSVGVYTGIKSDANKDAAKVMVNDVAASVDRFQMDMDRYPAAEEGLRELVERPDDEAEQDKWRGPYLKNNAVPKDPWGEEIKYERFEGEDASAPYRVYSTGPDKEDGTEDDISSFEKSEET
jgi:general secretion pathway protein G